MSSLRKGQGVLITRGVLGRGKSGVVCDLNHLWQGWVGVHVPDRERWKATVYVRTASVEPLKDEASRAVP
jgi:hypothetical protein